MVFGVDDGYADVIFASKGVESGFQIGCFGPMLLMFEYFGPDNVGQPIHVLFIEILALILHLFVKI